MGKRPVQVAELQAWYEEQLANQARELAASRRAFDEAVRANRSVVDTATQALAERDLARANAAAAEEGIPSVRCIRALEWWVADQKEAREAAAPDLEERQREAARRSLSYQYRTNVHRVLVLKAMGNGIVAPIMRTYSGAYTELTHALRGP